MSACSNTWTTTFAIFAITATVSYTHLDVYKSQVTVQGASIALPTFIVDVGRHCIVFEVAARKRADVDSAIARLASTCLLYTSRCV